MNSSEKIRSCGGEIAVSVINWGWCSPSSQTHGIVNILCEISLCKGIPYSLTVPGWHDIATPFKPILSKISTQGGCFLSYPNICSTFLWIPNGTSHWWQGFLVLVLLRKTTVPQYLSGYAPLANLIITCLLAKFPRTYTGISIQSLLLRQYFGSPDCHSCIFPTSSLL